MRTARFVMALILLMSAPLLAQWARRADGGVPSPLDRTPTLGAPPPRTADGKVDFSGVWAGPGFCLGDDPRVLEPVADSARPPVRTIEFDGRQLPLANCWDITGNVPGGVPLQLSAAALKKQRI